MAPHQTKFPFKNLTLSFALVVWLQIKAEKYLTPEQKEEEERKKLEAQKRLATQVCRHG